MKSKTLRDQAYSQIRNRIFTQDIKFGTKLSVAELSREFGISNSPIREAISLLEMDGLVVSEPNVGYRVVEFNDITFYELAQSIHVLLTGCYIDCVNDGKDDELAKLLEDRYRIQKNRNNGISSFEYACAAIDFDRSFVDVCANSMLNRMFESKFNLLVLCTMYVYINGPYDIESNLEQHRTILEAVKSKDRDQVIRLLDEHYDKHEVLGLLKEE